MEKTKKQGFFKSIKNSIFNFDSYQDFALEEMKRGIFYFLKLAILFSVIIAIVFSVLQVVVTIPNAKNFIASDIPDFSYSNGILDVKSDETVTIDNIADQVLIIADTKDLDETKINEYKDKINLYDIGVLVLKDKVYLKNSYAGTGLQEIPMSDIGSIYGKNEFTKQDIVNDINSINMISLCISLASASNWCVSSLYPFTVFLGFFITYLIMSILDIIILALLSNIVAMLLRVRMKVSALVNISVHAMTLPIILLLIYAIVLMTTGFEIKYFNIMYRGIAYIYVITAVFLIRQNLIKQQMELTTIVQKQKELKQQLEEKEKEQQEPKEKDEQKDKKEDESNDKKEEKDNNVGKEANGEV